MRFVCWTIGEDFCELLKSPTRFFVLLQVDLLWNMPISYCLKSRR